MSEHEAEHSVSDHSTGGHSAHHRGDPDALVDRAVDELRERGERVTTARRLMLGVLARHPDHLTADEVADRLRPDGVHRATVYRSLEALAASGVLTHRQLPGGASAYHLVTGTHLHLHCVRCQRVEALPVDVFDDAVQRIDQLRGFAFDANLSTLLGVCAQCRQERTVRSAR